jgi:hypothetical protein
MTVSVATISGKPMTPGNMRANGVRSLAVSHVVTLGAAWPPIAAMLVHRSERRCGPIPDMAPNVFPSSAASRIRGYRR